jgi:hypothetical protein
MSTAHLSLEEVQSRLKSYPDDNTGVTDELYSFGEILIKDAVERVSQSDTKAFALAAYAGGTISVIISIVAFWKGSIDDICRLIIFIGILGLILSAGFAIWAVRPLSMDWFSDNDWLRSECFRSRDWLRRYRIATMWKIVKSHQMASQMKGTWIERAQIAMLCSFGLLALALFEGTARIATLQWLWVWVRDFPVRFWWFLFIVVHIRHFIHVL